MIEELKLVLDTIGDLSGVAIWVVGAFFLFKLIIYLSTTGAIVFLIRLAITSLHDLLTKEKIIKFDIGSHMINSTCKESFLALISEGKKTSLSYIHEADIDWIRVAIREKKEREGNKK